MKIFKIKFDVNNIPEVVMHDERYEFEKHSLNFTGHSLRSEWIPFNCFIRNPKNTKMDFYSFQNDAFLFNDRVKSILSDYLDKFGEFLLLNIENAPNLQLFNLTAQCDCIDKDKTTYKAWFKHKTEGSVKEMITGLKNVPSNSYSQDIERVFLDISKIDKPLFFINDHAGWCHGPFCTSGLFPEDEEFYHICIKNKLKGIKFLEIDYMKPDGMKKDYEFLPWK
jgi:hypothetical protein